MYKAFKHTITEVDLENNPGLGEEVKVGEEIEIPGIGEDGNAPRGSARILQKYASLRKIDNGYIASIGEDYPSKEALFTNVDAALASIKEYFGE